MHHPVADRDQVVLATVLAQEVGQVGNRAVVAKPVTLLPAVFTDDGAGRVPGMERWRGIKPLQLAAQDQLQRLILGPGRARI